MWTKVFQHAGKRTRVPCRDVHVGDDVGVRPRVRADRAVLLPGRPQGLPRPLVLPGALPALRRAGRLRRGVRDRPRDRPPRAERARHRGAGPPAAAGGPGQRATCCSVRLELQADCFAGVWARSTYDRGILEPGDIEEGLRRPPRSATTGSAHGAGSSGHMARRSSACSGSARGSTPARPARATRATSRSNLPRRSTRDERRKRCQTPFFVKAKPCQVRASRSTGRNPEPRSRAAMG